MDSVTKSVRSTIMSKVKSKNTKLERRLRQVLWKNGLRYRINGIKFFGKPDIYNASKKLVIFVDSCFWHGCKKHCRFPTTNKKYWARKISNNRKRDGKVTKYYKDLGWIVIRLWEHDMGFSSLEDSAKLRQILK